MNPSKLLLLACLFVALGLRPVMPTHAQAPTDFVVIAAKAGVAQSLARADAKKLVLGQSTAWPNGQKVILVMRSPQSPDRVALLKKLCSMTEAEYTRYEMQVIFTGREAARVHDEPSDALVKAFVKANPTAVGFIHASEVDKDLRVVLSID